MYVNTLHYKECLIALGIIMPGVVTLLVLIVEQIRDWRNNHSKHHEKKE